MRLLVLLVVLLVLVPGLASAQVDAATIGEAAACPVLDAAKCPAFASILKAGPKALPPVLEAMSSEDRAVRRAAARIAGRSELGDAATRAEAVLKRVEEGSPEARASGLDALGRIDHASARSKLLAVVADPQAPSNERIIAANGLGTLKPPAALERLATALKSDEPRVQLAAAQNLGRLGDEGAVDALVNRALEELTPGYVRAAAATSLGQLGDPRATAALALLLANEHATVRASAARALGLLKAQSAVPLLVRFSTDDALAKAIAEALGAIGGARAAVALSQMVAGPQPKAARLVALWALGTIREPRTVPGVAKGLQDEDLEIVRASAEAMGRMKVPAAVTHLVDLLSHEDEQIRKVALWSLQEITGERHGQDVEAWRAWRPPAP